MEYINKKILNYQLTRFIGEGGMASVYEAVHQTFDDRKVAIKILNPILTANKNIRQRFVNEAKIMASLTHPNIVHVIDFDEQEQNLAIIMELLSGNDLTAYIQQNGALSAEQTKNIMTQVLDAFTFAHLKEVVHRDVKPSNIYILENGTPKILDFGIAKLFSSVGDFTTTGVQMGTLTYMSPEQIKDSKHIDARTDIYSLGVTLYYMLSGKKAYDTTTMSDYDVRKAIVEMPFPKLINKTQWQPIIDKATAKLPQDRFQSCEEFKHAVLGGNFAKVSNFGKVENQDDKTLIDKPQPEKQQDNDKTIVDNVENKIVESKKIVVENNESKSNDFKTPIIISIVVIVLGFVLCYEFGEYYTSKEVTKNKNTTNYENNFTEITENKNVTNDENSFTKITDYENITNVDNNFISAQTITETVNGIDFEFIEVPGGTFKMGSNDGLDDEKPVHSVTISSFSIGKYEVTQAQWKAVMGNNPSYFKNCDNCPVEQVSWDDIQDFLRKLKQQTGKTYRLPTEAEWEYAAGGGSSNRTEWAGTGSESSLGSYAWYDANSGSKTHPVGTNSPNRLGIYDMSGNVWEWCQDWKKGYPGSSGVTDYTGSDRVIRGGGWGSLAGRCRVAFRRNDSPDYSIDNLGFRLVFVP